MYKEIEVYMDDMIAKSRIEEEHLVNLQKLFERIPIEVDPDKVKATLDIPELRIEKQFRGFLGLLNYIARFISQFTACKMNYSQLERMCCALVWASHRLRQYMLSHTTWLVSKMDPIKYIFEKPALTGRMAWWHVLLSEFDIVYVTQKAIKGSALVDYLAQQPLNDYQSMYSEFPDENIMVLFGENVEDEDLDKWIMWFDGASNALGHGVGAALVSPDNQRIPFMARLSFDCTKNMVEYEACALEIQAAIDFNVKLLKVYRDSALVIHQLKGEWETTDHKLIPY
ncbi:uncharacterized protein LOC114378892 [Glycine soja]|uniref:uncharacterized protein LOC114378892 n=1 Tax=Glycine soja TaxID=3848 RepID=UPI00103E9A76|nr:uncharacterized protein LOC114378892 [Glycine soja]